MSAAAPFARALRSIAAPLARVIHVRGRGRVLHVLAAVLIAAAALPDAARAVVRMQEFSTGCSASDPAVAFLEIFNSQQITFDPRAGVAFYDRNDQLLLDVWPVFGSYAGTTWTPGAVFLLANDAFLSYTAVGPNRRAAMVPDPMRGRVVFYTLAADGVTRTTLDQLAYGGAGQPPAPPFQGSLQRTGAAQTAWTSTTNPTPTNLTANTPEYWLCAPIPLPPALHISEFGTRCWAGGPSGAFIELWSWDHTFTIPSNIGLRIRGANGSLLGTMPNVFGPYAGSSMAAGGRFLLGDPGYLSTFGAPADRTLPVPLDTLGGKFELYAFDTFGVEYALDSLRYGPTGVPAPTAGRSTEIIAAPPGYAQPESPTPVGWAGTSLLSRGCHFEGPVPMRLSEFAGACASGDSAGRFVEVEPLVPTGAIMAVDSHVRLRVYDHNTALTFETPLFPDPARPWPSGRRLLVAGPTFEGSTGLPPDVVANFSLDAQGTLDIVRHVDSNPTNPTLLSRAQYGFTVPQPAPPPGSSMRWASPVYPSYALDAYPTPERSDRRTLPGTGCFPRLDSLSARIDEVFPLCRSGEARAPFVELLASDTTRFKSGARLLVRDHTDAIVFDGSIPFGSRTNTPWLEGQRLLIAMAGVEPVGGSDVAIPVALDPVGGRITLAVDRSGDTPLVVDECAWGVLGIVVPPGASLQRAGESWTVADLPTPTNASGASSASPATCFGRCPFGFLTIYPGMIRVPQSDAACDTTIGGERVAFDARTGMLRVRATQQGVEASASDRYLLEGPPAGTPVTLQLRLPSSVDVLGEPCPSPPCNPVASAYLSIASDSPGTAYDLFQTLPLFGDGDFTLPLTVVAGQGFEFTATLQATPVGAGSRANAGTRWWFEDLPPGATLTSCRGWLGSLVGAPTPPAPAAFALRGVRPNPGRADIVSFALDRAGDVRVEVIDIAGRRVLEHRWEALGPGEHTRALARPGELRPGVYLVRLSHGGRTASTRAIVMP